jgi:ribosomal protein S18 acetylase RimI-like enzyme
MFIAGKIHIHTRPCKKTDYSFAFKLMEETIFPLVAVYFPPSKSMFDERFARDYHERVILMHGKRRIGVYQLRPTGKSADISGLFLTKDYRGRGIGAALMQHFETLGYDTLKLEVWDNNPAYTFYKKCGYKAIGKRKHKYLMEKKLR